MTDIASTEDLKPECVAKLEYNQIMEKDLWRVNMIKEILNMKYGELAIPEGWTLPELDELLNFACIS